MMMKEWPEIREQDWLDEEINRQLAYVRAIRDKEQSEKPILWTRQLPHLPQIPRHVMGTIKGVIVLRDFDLETVTNRRKQILLREDRWCQECGAKPLYQPLGYPNLVIMDNGGLATIDHYVPRDLGGGNHLENLQLLCNFCNEAKANSLPPGMELFPTNLTKRIEISA